MRWVRRPVSGAPDTSVTCWRNSWSRGGQHTWRSSSSSFGAVAGAAGGLRDVGAPSASPCPAPLANSGRLEIADSAPVTNRPDRSAGLFERPRGAPRAPRGFLGLETASRGRRRPGRPDEEGGPVRSPGPDRPRRRSEPRAWLRVPLRLQRLLLGTPAIPEADLRVDEAWVRCVVVELSS